MPGRSSLLREQTRQPSVVSENTLDGCCPERSARVGYELVHGAGSAAVKPRNIESHTKV